jgi:predicted lipoprotein with Yx(FWY)xxD motif
MASRLLPGVVIGAGWAPDGRMKRFSGMSAVGALVTRAVILTLGAMMVTSCVGDERSTSASENPASPSASLSESEVPSPSPAATAPSTTPPSVGSTDIVIKTADSEFGTMLFDRRGQAIYLFGKEATSTPRCYGACAEAWPPVLTEGMPRSVGKVMARQLGTTPRSDGSSQVTYAGHPLYYYAHEGPGEVLCHNVVEFGGRWLVVTPAGTPAPA